eukprot:2197026-Pyramimonas_sp.AAC.2
MTWSCIAAACGGPARVTPKTLCSPSSPQPTSAKVTAGLSHGNTTNINNKSTTTKTSTTYYYCMAAGPKARAAWGLGTPRN